MKKIILSLNLILFTALASFSQALKPVKIDSLVTVSLPAQFQKKDTLGQTIYSANSALGYIIVIRSENAKNNTALKKEKDLKKVMKTYMDDIKKQSKTGSIMNARDTTIGSLEAKAFTLSVDNSGSTGEAPQSRSFIVIYTQDVTYTFQYFYPDSRAEVAKAELKEFNSSIKISPQLKRNDQYLSNAKGLSTPLKIALFGGAPLIILIIVITTIRRKKKQNEA